MSAVLDAPTLVLNRHWTPVNVTSVRHALVLAFSDRAWIVCPYSYRPHSFDEWVRRGIVNGNPHVRGLHFEIEAPEVLVLDRYARVPPRGVVFNRKNLHRRDGRVCQYCGQSFPADDLTIDHVVPCSRGGGTNWSNCVLACRRCNSRKRDRTPDEAGMRLLRTPAEPVWSPRFAIYARENRPPSWDHFVHASEAALMAVAE